MIVLVVTAAALLPSVGAAAPRDVAEGAGGATVGFLVLDRDTGQSSIRYQEHRQFRSASLVKLLIALDFLESRDPAAIPDDDLALLESMLRSSDDDAASVLWVRGGFEAVVQRMVPKLGLVDTEPPADRRIWGYTAISAADIATTYRYILDRADPRVGEFIMANLRAATRCAVDGRDQYFGIPRAVPRPWAVKQGWSGYGEVPPDQRCASPGAGAGSDQRPFAATLAGKELAIPAVAADVDLVRPAMHTSGTIGADDGEILVVLSLQPPGTSYDESAEQVTNLTRTIHAAAQVPGI